MPTKTTKNSEKLGYLQGFSAGHLGNRRIERKGRFLFLANRPEGRFGSSPVWVLCYRGKAERLVLCKDLVINNPQVIADDWLEKHKDKFNDPEGTGDLIIKKEFKNLPYFGITPHRVIRRLGTEASLHTESGYTTLYWSAGDSSTPPPFLAALAR